MRVFVLIIVGGLFCINCGEAPMGSGAASDKRFDIVCYSTGEKILEEKNARVTSSGVSGTRIVTKEGKTVNISASAQCRYDELAR